ncbi:cytochrome b5 [Trichoderma arundinaceum]|uniref:Cytochrome b5 n=1 Tax=Trichoderma arundinaceum TaxID=490622 RepID=A0A395NEV2_TRIAR|nr:cytochrome b5 [Trichoderma arundinaceum]
MSKEYSYQDVAEHNTKKDLFVVIHDKVYDCTKFVDEHPYVFAIPRNATSALLISLLGEEIVANRMETSLVLTLLYSGGEEVMLDVAGQDATEAFEDVGHSDEARETLEALLVGDLKRQPGDPVPKTSAKDYPAVSSSGTGGGFGLYSIVAIGGLLAYFAYQYIQADAANKAQSA